MFDSRCESHIKPAVADIYNVASGALAPQSDRVSINQQFRGRPLKNSLVGTAVPAVSSR